MTVLSASGHFLIIEIGEKENKDFPHIVHFVWYGEAVCTHDQNKQGLVHKGTHQHKTNNQKEEKTKEMTSTNKKRDKEDFWVCFGGKREQLWSRTCLLLFFFLFSSSLDAFQNKINRINHFFCFLFLAEHQQSSNECFYLCWIVCSFCLMSLFLW
jgi:hypothetical protein